MQHEWSQEIFFLDNISVGMENCSVCEGCGRKDGEDERRDTKG